MFWQLPDQITSLITLNSCISLELISATNKSAQLNFILADLPIDCDNLIFTSKRPSCFSSASKLPSISRAVANFEQPPFH